MENRLFKQMQENGCEEVYCRFVRSLNVVHALLEDDEAYETTLEDALEELEAAAEEFDKATTEHSIKWR